MGDVTIDAVRSVVRGWRTEVAERRRITKADAVADTLEYCAGEVEQQLAALEHAVPRLTVEEYAARHHVTPQTVRTWCRKGLLPAQPTAKGWRIAADAEPARRSA